MVRRIWDDNDPTKPLSAARMNGIEDDIEIKVDNWKANTSYTAGQRVLSPAGTLVTAFETHTSGTAFNQTRWYADLGYLVACFTANGVSGEQLSFFYSPDGKTIYGGGGNPAYTDTNTGTSLRDPSINRIGELFVEVHTVNNGIDKNFAVLTGTSLADLSQTSLINCSSLPDISRIWAPELVFDPATPTRPYVFFSKINAAGTNGVMYWIQATNDALTTWTAPVQMSWASEPAHYIDGTFVKRNNAWYMFYSTGTDVFRATSTTLTGTYTTDKGTSNWAGWGTDIEGPEIVQYGPSNYRIYVDRYEADLGYAWSESTDLETWTSLTGLSVATGAIPPGERVRHGSFYKILDDSTFNHVMAQVSLPKRDPLIIYAASYDQGTNGAVTPVSITSAGANGITGSPNQYLMTSDGAGKYTFKEAGDYAIWGTFNVTAGTGVTRSFAQMENGAGTLIHGRTPGAAEDQFNLVIPTYRALAGEQVLFRTHLTFTGGGSATISGTLRIALRSN